MEQYYLSNTSACFSEYINVLESCVARKCGGRGGEVIMQLKRRRERRKEMNDNSVRRNIHTQTYTILGYWTKLLLLLCLHGNLKSTLFAYKNHLKMWTETTLGHKIISSFYSTPSETINVMVQWLIVGEIRGKTIK